MKREQFWLQSAAMNRVTSLMQANRPHVTIYRDMDMGSPCWWVEWK